METKRAFTPETIKELERRGLTMPGGGYPIETIGDLENAVQAFGRAKDPEKTKAWIIRRAHELGKTDLLPEGWVDKHEPDTDEDDTKAADAQATEHKVVPVGGFKVLDEDEGIAETIVSVTGIQDRVKDTILPGAYAKTLQERIPRGVWGHDWNTPISKTLEIKELLPGDPGLPKKLRNGKPWPAKAGALMVRTQFNLETQRGREAFSDVKFFGEDQEWSIGYNVPAGKAVIDPKTGARQIKELVLHEYSPVLHGAMPEAVTQSVKSAQTAYAALEAAYPTDGLEPETKDDYPTDGVEPTLSEADIQTLFGDVAAEVDMDVMAGEAGAAEAKRATPGRGHRGNAETLRRYWSTGEGAAKIAWGTDGDFMRCVTHISKYMSPEKAKGYCNLLHHRSLGIWPAQHKDVTNGSYERGIDPGLAGVNEDGSDPMTCPNCGGELDIKGCCMDKDCPMFQMDVKEAARAVLAMQVKAMLEDGILTLDELLPSSAPVDPRTGAEAKVDITLDLMEADLLDMELEEKAAYIRKQRHGGWIWAGRGGGHGEGGVNAVTGAAFGAQAARVLSHEQGLRNLADAGPTGRGESTHADFTDLQARSAQQQFRGRGDVRRSASVDIHDNGEGTPVTVKHGDKTMKLRPGVIEKIQPNFDASTIFGIEKHPTSGADFLAVAPLNAPREHYNEQGHKVSMQPSTEVAAAGGSPQDIRAALRGEHPDWTHQRVASAAARMHSDAQKPKPAEAKPALSEDVQGLIGDAADRGIELTPAQAQSAIDYYGDPEAALVEILNNPPLKRKPKPAAWKPEIDPNTGDLTADSLQKYIDTQKLPDGWTATVDPGDEWTSASITLSGPNPTAFPSGTDYNERASTILVTPDGKVEWAGSRGYESDSLPDYIQKTFADMPLTGPDSPGPDVARYAGDLPAGTKVKYGGGVGEIVGPDKHGGISVRDSTGGTSSVSADTPMYLAVDAGNQPPPGGYVGERQIDVGPGRAATPREASLATAQDDLVNGYPSKVSDANLRAIADMTDRHPDYDQHTTELAQQELVKRGLGPDRGYGDAALADAAAVAGPGPKAPAPKPDVQKAIDAIQLSEVGLGTPKGITPQNALALQDAHDRWVRLATDPVDDGGLGLSPDEADRFAKAQLKDWLSWLDGHRKGGAGPAYDLTSPESFIDDWLAEDFRFGNTPEERLAEFRSKQGGGTSSFADTPAGRALEDQNFHSELLAAMNNPKDSLIQAAAEDIGQSAKDRNALPDAYAAILDRHMAANDGRITSAVVEEAMTEYGNELNKAKIAQAAHKRQTDPAHNVVSARDAQIAQIEAAKADVANVAASKKALDAEYAVANRLPSGPERQAAFQKYQRSVAAHNALIAKVENAGNGHMLPDEGKTIRVRNQAQKLLLENELKGQISDGMWENSSPDWQDWTSATVIVDPQNVGRNWNAVKDNYALNHRSLLDIVGDRMVRDVQENHDPAYTSQGMNRDLADLRTIFKTKRPVHTAEGAIPNLPGSSPSAPKASGNTRPFDTALTERQKAQIPAELQDASYEELASWFESHGNPRAAAFLRRKAGGSKEVWVDEYEVKDVFDALAEYQRLADEGVI